MILFNSLNPHVDTKVNAIRFDGISKQEFSPFNDAVVVAPFPSPAHNLSPQRLEQVPVLYFRLWNKGHISLTEICSPTAILPRTIKRLTSVD